MTATTYRACMKSDTRLERQHQSALKVVFEYVWPDENSDYVDAKLDLMTGQIALNAKIPEGVENPLVERRIWVVTSGEPLQPGYGDDYPVTYNERPPNWRVAPEDLELISLKIHLEGPPDLTPVRF